MKCICGLCMAFKNFLGLFLFFLRSLIPKKSSGMQKPYVWLVTPPMKNQHKNSILVHCDMPLSIKSESYILLFTSNAQKFLQRVHCTYCDRGIKDEKKDKRVHIYLVAQIICTLIIDLMFFLGSWNIRLHQLYFFFNV